MNKTLWKILNVLSWYCFIVSIGIIIINFLKFTPNYLITSITALITNAAITYLLWLAIKKTKQKIKEKQ